MNFNPLKFTKNSDFKKELWNEAKKINWKNVNKESSKRFIMTLIGDSLTFDSFAKALEISPYDFMGVKTSSTHPLTPSALAMFQKVDIDQYGAHRHVIQNSNILIVDQRYIHRVDIPLNQLYIMTLDDMSPTFEAILDDNSGIEQALCFNYPAFRSIGARKIITAVAFQNAAWAGGTSLPNTIPGVHQILLTPIEAASDFTILTLNEIRMTFILSGVAGRVTNPGRLLPELMILLTGAKGAEMLATQTIGKVPAGAGVALKATIAFAFTYAIGEAVYLNLNYGIKINKQTIKGRMKDLTTYAKNMTTDLFKNKSE